MQVTKTLVQAGPYGFAQGVFPGHTQVFDSDMPNLYLLPVAVQQKDACRKRPASKAGVAPEFPPGEEEAEEEEEEQDEQEQQDEQQQQMERQEPEEQDEPEEPIAAPAAPQYRKRFWKKSGAWAVRSKFFGRRQIFQVTCAQKSKQQLENIVDATILRLSSGQSEAEVKQWVKDQVRPARGKHC